jgi:hypothetical protein
MPEDVEVIPEAAARIPSTERARDIASGVQEVEREPYVRRIIDDAVYNDAAVREQEHILTLPHKPYGANVLPRRREDGRAMEHVVDDQDAVAANESGPANAPILTWSRTEPSGDLKEAPASIEQHHRRQLAHWRDEESATRIA